MVHFSTGADTGPLTRSYSYAIGDRATSEKSILGLAQGAATRTHQYFYGPQGLISEQENDAAPVHPLAEPQGTITGYVSGAGELTRAQELDPFGARRGQAPPAPIGQVAALTDQPFDYLGAHARAGMTASGLVHMGARLYDPSLGRFLSRDPLPGDLGDPQSQTPYAYGLNNPLRFQDLDGNKSRPFVPRPDVGGDPTMGKGCLGGESPGAEKHSISDWSADILNLYTAGISNKIAGVCGNETFEVNPMLALLVPGPGGKAKGLSRISKAMRRALRGERAAAKLKRFDRAAYSAAGKAKVKGGRTAAGRTYQKHMDRGEVPRVPGKNLDQAGQKLLDDILSNPNSTVQDVSTGRAAGGKRILSPDGYGVTFNPDGSLAYFGRY